MLLRSIDGPSIIATLYAMSASTSTIRCAMNACTSARPCAKNARARLLLLLVLLKLSVLLC